MKIIKCLISSIIVLSLAACAAAPKRGDVAYAPVMPMIGYGPSQPSDSIYQMDSAWLLHEDIRARHVGDMLTVTLQEQTDAEQTAETGSSKSTSGSITAPTLLGKSVTDKGVSVLDNSIASDHSFDGKGETTQSNSLSGSVTVIVVNVLQNGHLVVQGEKWINLNQGEEYIRLRGIVRPEDINPDNTIASTRIANADIQYGGDSFLAHSNEPGWLTKFLQSKWMPF